MALPEVLMTSTYNSDNQPVNVNEYTPLKGPSLLGNSNDPAYADANPGPIPTTNPIYGRDRFYILWEGNNGQPPIYWSGYANEAQRDDEYTAILSTLSAPVS